MHEPHPNSPNGCWKRHGYTSTPSRDNGICRLRDIYSPTGEKVLEQVGYQEQIDYCREHGMLLPESELEKLE